MKKHMLLILVVVFGVLSAMVLVPFGQVAEAQGKLVAPVIFQAADQPPSRFRARSMRTVLL